MTLSALHGLVDPEDRLEPYDLALTSLRWRSADGGGQKVVEGLASRFGSLDGSLFEVHAGAAYRQAIERPLERLGSRVAAPLGHLRLGQQLAWYAAH
jgi:hypothetical protein